MKILFIQHARTPGGSAMSLLYTIRALNKDIFHAAVALVQPDKAIRDLYEKENIPVYEARGLTLFQHSTARWACFSRPRTWIEPIKSLLRWHRVGAVIERLRKEYSPDIIHLNSVVLAPAADYLLRANIPFVWHVRESPVPGYFGFRLKFMRSLLRRAGERVIFLSESDKRAWVCGTNGTVVHNFIDLARFTGALTSPSEVSIPDLVEDRPNLLFLGGMTKIKGFMVLLDALKILKDEGVEVNCICPGTLNHGVRSSGKCIELIKSVLVSFGMLPYWKKCENRIGELGLEKTIYRLPFITEIALLYGMSDCLVFPAMEPHFARPVIEAQACGVPVVASEIDGVTELMEGVDCGLMVSIGDAVELSSAIKQILQETALNPVRAENGRRNACENFNSIKQVMKIETLYERQEAEEKCI